MESVVQGDSIERDVKSSSVADFTGWTGVWAIADGIGGDVLKTGTLTLSTDKTCLECRVPPYDDGDVLPLGFYIIEIQVSNAALSFRRTLPREEFEIVAQTVTP